MQNDISTTKSSSRDLATLPFEEALELYSPNLAAVLPPDVSLEHFKKMVVSALNANPDLRYADRRTLFNACVKCASDGVLPDGREAALVVFRTKVKDREGKERWIDAVNYMIMVAGIRKRLRNTGEVLSAEAEVVYANDHFRQQRGDNPLIEHEPAPLDQDPGNVVGSYAIIKLANGETLREIVRLRDIERARAASKAPNSPAWKDWYDQMARKVALRRCAKAAPSSSGTMRAARALEQMLARDEEPPELPSAEELPAIPSRPRREDFIDHEAEEKSVALKYEATDLFGETIEFATEMEAIEALSGWIRETRSLRALDGLAERNPAYAHYPVVIEAYKDQKEALSNPGDRQDRPAPGAQQTDPARGATDTAGTTGQTEHPEAHQSSTPNERMKNQISPSEATPRGEPDSLAVDLARYEALGDKTNWDGVAAEMEARIAKINDPSDAEPQGRFIQQNRQTLEGMRTSNKTAWSTVNYRLNDRYRVLMGGEP